MNFDFITKMISPAKGVQMLKAGIENIIGEPVNHFEVIYVDAKEEVYFKVWSEKYGVFQRPYTGSNKDMLIFAVKNLARMNLKEGQTLDMLKCEHNIDGSINLDVFMTENNEKIKHSILNHKP